MVSNGLYDINCEEGSHSNSLSYFSHVSLSFFATLYLQNAKKEHVKVFVARYFFQKNTPFYCLFSQIHVSHILPCLTYMYFHFHANVYCPPTKLREGNVFICVCLLTRGSPCDHYHMMHWTSLCRHTWLHSPTWTSDMGSSLCYWHLVAITGDLFKVVHLKFEDP